MAGTDVNIENDKTFKNWKDWQKTRDDSFYENNLNVENFIQMNKNIKFPLDPAINSNPSIKYCFGDFSNFIIIDKNCNIDLDVYCTILLAYYDMNKGYFRILSDPEPIYRIRRYLEKKDIKILYDQNESQYEASGFVYPYFEIHAHTVAYYSLSSLIYTLVLDFIYKFNGVLCPRILPQKLDQAVGKKAFSKKKISMEDVKYRLPRKYNYYSLPNNI